MPPKLNLYIWSIHIYIYVCENNRFGIILKFEWPKYEVLVALFKNCEIIGSNIGNKKNEMKWIWKRLK